jgi:hypothetical protein
MSSWRISVRRKQIDINNTYIQIIYYLMHKITRIASFALKRNYLSLVAL